MKKLLLLLLLFVSFTSVYKPQSFNGRFSSSLYTFERFDTAGSSATHARAFQMLTFNVGKENVWLRTYLNLEHDISKSLKTDPRLRFYNLYVDIRDLLGAVFFKLGRQPLFNSIAGGVFDGGTLGFNYQGYKLFAYYGGNVPAYQKLEITDDFSNDYIFGGEFTVYALTDWRFTAKYVNKNFKFQSYEAVRLDPTLLNRDTILIQNKSHQYEFLSGEISFDKPDLFRIDARYDYDMNYKTTSKVEFTGRYEQVENLGITLYFNYREPRIRYNSIFSVFDYGNTWEIEAGVDYLVEERYSVIGKFANVSFKEVTSQRLMVGISSPWGTLTGRKTFGYAGELDAISLYGAYGVLNGLLTPTFGFSFTRYKQSEFAPRNEMVTIMAGANLRPWRTLSFDFQGQYHNNKIYKNDWRLFFKLNFWFYSNFN